MAEATKEGDQVTQDNQEPSSLIAEPELNQSDAVKKLTYAFKKVFKDIRSGYHYFGPPLIHTGFTHKYLCGQIS